MTLAISPRAAARSSGVDRRQRNFVQPARIEPLVVAGEDFDFLFRRRIHDADFQQKPVELSFRQRVRAFELNGILRRQHREVVGQRIARAIDGDLPFLHRFEQRRLRARRGAIDFVHQQQVGEHRPAMQSEKCWWPY